MARVSQMSTFRSQQLIEIFDRAPSESFVLFAALLARAIWKRVGLGHIQLSSGMNSQTEP